MTLQKKTKIVATIGPETSSQAMLEKLLKAGVNIARLNFSHGDFAEHQEKVDNGKKATQKTGLPLAYLQDLGGPKIRTGEFDTPNGRIILKKGKTLTLTTDKVKGSEERVSVNYAKLPKEVKVGDHIMVDDGKKKLKVEKIKGNDIVCKVIFGGELKGRRGLNFPDSDLSISSLTPKDRKDLEFGIKNDVDFIALSFVRDPKDIKVLRGILDKAKSKAHIIAKVETPQAIEHIDEIIELADGVMVARGDLAVEVPAERVPLLQKIIIQKCNEAGKPVITATQMLESMIENPRPTRAEVSDVANAILDGTDAVMLSEETTLGAFPVEAVEMMTQIAKQMESNFDQSQFLYNEHADGDVEIGDSITISAVRTAQRVGARYIVPVTHSGHNARSVSRHKPEQDIIVFTPKEKTFQQIQLNYGCNPILTKPLNSLKDVIDTVRKELIKEKIATKGDRVVIIASMPFGEIHQPNMILVETL